MKLLLGLPRPESPHPSMADNPPDADLLGLSDDVAAASISPAAAPAADPAAVPPQAARPPPPPLPPGIDSEPAASPAPPAPPAGTVPEPSADAPAAPAAEYKISAAATGNVAALMSADAEDEALAKYKASLLGAAAQGDLGDTRCESPSPAQHVESTSRTPACSHCVFSLPLAATLAS